MRRVERSSQKKWTKEQKHNTNLTLKHTNLITAKQKRKMLLTIYIQSSNNILFWLLTKFIHSFNCWSTSSKDPLSQAYDRNHSLGLWNHKSKELFEYFWYLESCTRSCLSKLEPWPCGLYRSYCFPHCICKSV